MKDRERFLVGLNILSDTFGRPLSKLAIKIYWTALEAFTDDEVEAAIERAAVSSKFMPPPAVIVEMIPRRKTRMELAQEADVAAWQNR